MIQLKCMYFTDIYVDTPTLVIGDLKLSLNNFTNDTSYLFTTIDEIVNARKILNCKVLEHVISFFYRISRIFIFCRNINNQAYEIPTVQYGGSSIDINYRIFMGIARPSMALFGHGTQYGIRNCIKIWSDEIII